MRHPRRTLAAGLAVAALAGALGAQGAGAGPAAAGLGGQPVEVDRAAARLTAGWLVSRQGADGSVSGGFGSLFGTTARAAYALEMTGGQDAAVAKALGYLRATVTTGPQSGNADAPINLAYAVLAAVDGGADPRSFGGSDLVARLEATQQPTGMFGTQPPTFDGALRQGTALVALVRAGGSAAVVQRGLTWLQGQQCPDGGWGGFNASAAVRCTSEDSNATAAAVQGLLAAGADASKGVAAFARWKGADGGYGFSSTSSDPDSTGLVMNALLAAGQYVGGALPALRSFQRPDGHYVYPGSEDPNDYAAIEALPALAGAWLGDAAHVVPVEVRARPGRPLGGAAGQGGRGGRPARR